MVSFRPSHRLVLATLRDDQQKAYAAGLDAYLTKLIDHRTLEDLIERFVGRTSSGAARCVQ